MRRLICAMLAVLVGLSFSNVAYAKKKKRDEKVEKAVRKALDYLARQQSPQGYWEANGGQYRIAMTALCGMAMLCEGSTATTGRYSKNIYKAVEYLTSPGIARANGLIGFKNDYRYTYGHGFSMLFLSQVYGDEEDASRRKELKKVLTRAVKFSRDAQTSRGGWGYVSAKEGRDFDEGSTCITQVQGLRACRNAGIAVPKDVIDRAKKYIYDCMVKSGAQKGGIVYSYQNRGSSGARPPITAAACAAMFNSGEYDGANVKAMLDYCKKYVWPGGGTGARTSFGHWHYSHYYYAQVVYRLGDKEWKKYMGDVGGAILKKQSADGSWKEGYIGNVYTTAINATILQLDKGYIPIYQR
ncbi:MAG: terpene cyclase/mutase family protein [Planctomycetaceae bacterium]